MPDGSHVLTEIRVISPLKFFPPGNHQWGGDWIGDVERGVSLKRIFKNLEYYFLSFVLEWFLGVELLYYMYTMALLYVLKVIQVYENAKSCFYALNLRVHMDIINIKHVIKFWVSQC